MAQVSFNIDPDLYSEFKKLLIDEGTTVTEDLTKFIKLSLDKNRFNNFSSLIERMLNILNLDFKTEIDDIYDKIFKLNGVSIFLSEYYADSETKIGEGINIDLAFTKEGYNDEEDLRFYMNKQYASISANYPTYYKNINLATNIQKEAIKLIGCMGGIINLEEGNIILFSQIKYSDIPSEEELVKLIGSNTIIL